MHDELTEYQTAQLVLVEELRTALADFDQHQRDYRAAEQHVLQLLKDIRRMPHPTIPDDSHRELSGTVTLSASATVSGITANDGRNTVVTYAAPQDVEPTPDKALLQDFLDRVIGRLGLTVEGDGYFVVSDDFSLVYGDGETPDQAIVDYLISLGEYAAIVLRAAAKRQPASQDVEAMRWEMERGVFKYSGPPEGNATIAGSLLTTNDGRNSTITYAENPTTLTTGGQVVKTEVRCPEWKTP